MGVLSTIVDALDTLDQDIQVPMALTGSDRASGIIRGLVLWAGSVANVAAQAVDELDLLDTAGLEPLGDAMSQTVEQLDTQLRLQTRTQHTPPTLSRPLYLTANISTILIFRVTHQ
jgi:hypothetical protein